jgi:hypothetical protein
MMYVYWAVVGVLLVLRIVEAVTFSYWWFAALIGAPLVFFGLIWVAIFLFGLWIYKAEGRFF